MKSTILALMAVIALASVNIGNAKTGSAVFCEPPFTSCPPPMHIDDPWPMPTPDICRDRLWKWSINCPMHNH